MVKKQLYIRLKELREANKLTQEDVAKYLNISRQSVSQWEKGASTPDIDNLVLLSRMYNITLDELVTGEEAINTPSETVVEQEVQKEESVRTNKEMTFEILCLTVILVLTCRISIIGIVVAVGVMIWMSKGRRHYKMIYVLCVFAILISIQNTYVILDYYFDFGQAYIEKIE